MDNPFYQALTNEDVQVRAETVKGLAAFAEQLGVVRTREELLPALTDICLLDDDDEVLQPLAVELGKFFPLVGGESHVAPVLLILENLSKSEESRVCNNAASSLVTIGSHLSDASFQNVFVALVIRLAEAQFFPAKASSCTLFPETLKRVNGDVRKKLLSIYAGLCKDKTPMVRRAAATHLKNIFPLLSAEDMFDNFVEAYNQLAIDHQDSVRLLVVEVAAALARSMTEGGKADKNLELVKPVVLACARDKSWRVRYMVASSFVSIANGLGADVTKSIAYLFEDLLRDKEQEVRTAAAGKISGVCALLDLDHVIKKLLPCVSSLVTDESQQVRSALASDILLLAPLFGNEGTSKHLLEIFLLLLKDEVPDVRLNIISKLDRVTAVIGLDQISVHLIPAIRDLAEDKQWRIRSSVIKYIPPLARQLSVEYFSTTLLSLCFSWLQDTVYAVRKAGIENVKELITIFGEGFTKAHVLPQLREIMGKTNYLYRMTVVLFLTEALDSLSDNIVKDEFLPIARQLAQDPVPNIRFAVIAVLIKLGARLDKETKESVIRPLFANLAANDVDKDVKERAQTASSSL